MHETNLDGLELIRVTEPNSLERKVAGYSLDVVKHLRDRGLAIEQRDAAIRAAFRAGSTQTKLATISGLTRQRIQQICGKDEER